MQNKSQHHLLTITSVVGVEGMRDIQAHYASESHTARNCSLSPNREIVGVTHNHQDESDFQPHKRPRLSEYIPTTILDYTSDDETDDTYTDSDGVERDFEDDASSFLDSRGCSPQVELSERTELSSDTDTSQGGIQWSAIQDLDDDSSDSDYQQPDWDMEDIWELEAMAAERDDPLFSFEYTKELYQCQGVMSDGSLSTDDPDAGYNQVGMLRHFFKSQARIYSRSLGPFLLPPKWDNPNHEHMIGDTLFKPSEEDAIERYRQARWHRAKSLASVPIHAEDFERRFAELLHSDHSRFYFDDEEWKYFAPNPISSRRTNPPPPKQLSMEDMIKQLLTEFQWEDD